MDESHVRLSLWKKKTKISTGPAAVAHVAEPTNVKKKEDEGRSRPDFLKMFIILSSVTIGELHKKQRWISYHHYSPPMSSGGAADGRMSRAIDSKAWRVWA
jgi:hypothetical protein